MLIQRLNSSARYLDTTQPLSVSRYEFMPSGPKDFLLRGDAIVLGGCQPHVLPLFKIKHIFLG